MSGSHTRATYPDERWALVEPVISVWKAQHPSVSGHSGRYEMREIVNALLYQSRTGCQWDYLPHDLPPPGAVKYYFCTWRDDGTDELIHDLLRWKVRERRGRLEDPSLVVLDTQSLHAASGVPASTTGRDANKRVPGRKRALAVDVLGLVIAAAVVPACTHDNAAGIALLDKVAADNASVVKALVDQEFKNVVVDHGQKLGIEVEVVTRNPGDVGFVPQAKRWVVEQTNGILMLSAGWCGTTKTRLLGRVANLLGYKRRDGPSADRYGRTDLARRMTNLDLTLGAVLVLFETREQQITAEQETVRAQIAELSAQLTELEQEAASVTTTRQTLLALPGRVGCPIARDPAGREEASGESSRSRRSRPPLRHGASRRETPRRDSARRPSS